MSGLSRAGRELQHRLKIVDAWNASPGCSITEVATQLKMSVNTVKHQLNRAKLNGMKVRENSPEELSAILARSNNR